MTNDKTPKPDNGMEEAPVINKETDTNPMSETETGGIGTNKTEGTLETRTLVKLSVSLVSRLISPDSLTAYQFKSF